MATKAIRQGDSASLKSAASTATLTNHQQQQAVAADALSVILATGSYDNTIRFWEAWSGICNRTIQHPESQINRLAISPDKRYLAAAGNQKVHLYDIMHQPIGGANTQPVATLEGHTANVTCVVWQNEGKWIATGSEDSSLKIWDPRSPQQPQRNFDQKSVVNDCIVHPNQGEIISCDQRGSIKMWDLTGKSCTHELLPEEDVPMRSITMAANESKLVGGNNKGYVYVWGMTNGKTSATLEPINRFQAHNKYLTRALLSPDSKHLATGSADTTIKIWDVDDNFKLEKVLTGHQRWVWDLAFSADSAYLVSASSDHTARLWELGSGSTVRQYTGHHKAASCCALNDTTIG